MVPWKSIFDINAIQNHHTDFLTPNAATSLVSIIDVAGKRSRDNYPKFFAEEVKHFFKQESKTSVLLHSKIFFANDVNFVNQLTTQKEWQWNAEE